MHGTIPTRPPAVLGHEPAGIIEAVGSNVTSVKPGDHVIACTSIYCGQCPSVYKVAHTCAAIVLLASDRKAVDRDCHKRARP